MKEQSLLWQLLLARIIHGYESFPARLIQHYHSRLAIRNGRCQVNTCCELLTTHLKPARIKVLARLAGLLACYSNIEESAQVPKQLRVLTQPDTILLSNLVVNEECILGVLTISASHRGAAINWDSNRRHWAGGVRGW